MVYGSVPSRRVTLVWFLGIFCLVLYFCVALAAVSCTKSCRELNGKKIKLGIWIPVELNWFCPYTGLLKYKSPPSLTPVINWQKINNNFPQPSLHPEVWWSAISDNEAFQILQLLFSCILMCLSALYFQLSDILSSTIHVLHSFNSYSEFWFFISAFLTFNLKHLLTIFLWVTLIQSIS